MEKLSFLELLITPLLLWFSLSSTFMVVSGVLSISSPLRYTLIRWILKNSFSSNIISYIEARSKFSGCVSV